MGVQLQIVNASNSREIDLAFATFARERSDALFVSPDSSNSASAGSSPAASMILIRTYLKIA
jgi:hypothetical protein